jgi:hypothetical protein
VLTVPIEIHIILNPQNTDDEDDIDMIRKGIRSMRGTEGTVMYQLDREVQYRAPFVNPVATADSKSVLDLSIDSLNIRRAARTSLRLGYQRGEISGNIVTVGDLIGYSANDLMKCTGFGKACLSSVRLALAAHNLHLVEPDHTGESRNAD